MYEAWACVSVITCSFWYYQGKEKIVSQSHFSKTYDTISFHHYLWVPGRTMQTQRAVLQGNYHSARGMCLKSWHLQVQVQPIANLSFVCFICRNFNPSKILSSNISSCNFIYNANGVYKLWEFYCSLPFAGNKPSMHNVSFFFPARCARSCRSAGHTVIWRVSSQNELYPFWSIWDIWDLRCWNIKKTIRNFIILLIITSKIFLYI